MRVLLATDGSEQSFHAAKAVMSLASVSTLTILHVIDLPRLTFSMLGPEIAYDLSKVAEEALRKDGEQALTHTNALLSDKVKHVEIRLEEGSPAEHILSVSQEEHPDLILMGARGRGQVEELFLGSVSQRVLTHAACPVLIINGPLTEIKKILIAIQSPDDVQKVGQFLTKHPFQPQTEITLLSVVPIPRSLFRGGVSAPEEKIEQALKSTEDFLDQAVSQLKNSYDSVKGYVGLGAPANTILEQASITEPDLLAMGMHHPSTITRFVLGTVSHTVLHQATRSVLVIR
ncbi:MAG TPA: universal stress protein [Nitrospirales bacterium]|nr:universal stress protein [Nitrospira sp. MA-1]HNP61492.1 universal stress protein [Nitrospirales bacterium]